MLLLSRSKSETVLIGNDIVIKVLYVDRNTVKLGIEAPKSVRILRAELTRFESAPEVAAALNTVVLNTVALNAAKTESKSEMATQSEVDKEIDANSDFQYLPIPGFDTDYAMELENQMLCIAPC